MNTIKKLFSSWVLPMVLIGLIFPNLFALAQEQQSPWGNRDKRESFGVYSSPAVFATDLLYNQKQGRGYFTILNNSDDVVSDIIYRIEVLGEIPKATSENPVVEDTANLFHRKTVDAQTYSLKSKEKKFVEFQFATPNLASGKYRLRIQITSPKGEDLGWKDANFELTNKNTGFLDAVTGTIVVPEYGETLIPPMSGPNVTANSEIKFNATVENKNTVKLSVVPVVRLFKLDGSLATEVIGAETSFAGRKEALVQTPITTPNDPGAYYAQLYWRDLSNQQVSPLLEYKIVVKGESARINGLRVKSYKLEENRLPVIVEVFGPADAVTTMKGKLGLEIKDDEGVLGSFIVPDELTLDDALTSGTAMVPIQRSSRGQVVLMATLKGIDGKVLDTYEIKIEPLRFTEKAPINATKTNSPAVSYGVLVAIIVVVLIVVGVMALFFKKYEINWKFLGLFILILLPLIATGVYAEGNGIEVLRKGDKTDAPSGSYWYLLNLPSGEGRHMINLFINDPIHERFYSRNSVPISYRVEWAVCQNRFYNADVFIHYLAQGDKISTFKPPAGNSFKLVSRNSWYVDCKGSSDECFDCNTGYCMTGRNQVAPSNISLGLLDLTKVNTTMRFLARWSTYSNLAWEETESSYNFVLNTGANGMKFHALNLWLNISKIQCTASNSTPVVGEPVNFNVTGGDGNYTWSNVEGNPSTGAGVSYSALFNSIGTKNINVSDTTGTTGTCTVNVDYPPFSCAITPSQTYSGQVVTINAQNGAPQGDHFWWKDSAGTMIGETTTPTFSQTLTSVGTKNFSVEKGDCIPFTIPLPVSVNSSNTTGTMVIPADGKIALNFKDDNVAAVVTRVEDSKKVLLGVCDANDASSVTADLRCNTTYTKKSNGNTLLCNRDNTEIKRILGSSNWCPDSTKDPISVKKGDVVKLQHFLNSHGTNGEGSMTYTPDALCMTPQVATCSVQVVEGPQIEVSYGGPAGNRIVASNGGTVILTPNATRTFYVKNIGSESLTVNGIATTKSGPGNFSVTGTSAFTLVAGDERPFNVSLSGDADDTTRGRLSISNTSPINPYELNLTTVTGEGEGGPEVDLKIKESTQADKGIITIPRGQGVTLEWDVKEVASCEAGPVGSSNSWMTPLIKVINDVPNQYQRINNIDDTTSYSLNCTGNNGSTTGDTVTVTVSDTSSGTNIRDL